MTDNSVRPYDETVVEFVRLGAELIATDPCTRYGPSIGERPRALEPGFIPPDSPAKLTIVSYYPNASTLGVVGYDEMDERFRRWGQTGALADYRRAHTDWVDALEMWPFYRKWMRDIILELELAPTGIAWLPLVKLPHMPESPPADEVVRLDRTLLREQLELLRPHVIWVQSKEVDESTGGLVREITSTFVVQKLYKTKTTRTSPETSAIVSGLRRYLR